MHAIWDDSMPEVRPARSKYLIAGLLLTLAAFSVLAYARSLWLPLIADDYLQVRLGRDYGPVSGWAGLAGDPLYRSRSTSILMTYWTERIFGFSPMAFALSSLGVHILNTWLIFAAGAWKRIGWRAGFIAAAFFAVYEGHQEAVIWYAALPELLVFFFSVSCLILWISWLDQQGPLRYAAALGCFVLALLSKESAVALIPILALIVRVETGGWKRLADVAPFATLGVLNVAGIFLGHSRNQHFQDSTFSLHAPFWLVWTNSMGRLFWFAGLAAMLAIAFWKQIRKRWRLLVPALGWTAITLLPYCFLTYMPRIPSRHTYLASAGLSLIVAAAFLALEERCWLRRTWLPAAVASALVLANCTYLWTRKQAQYAARAEPTAALIRYVNQVHGQVHVHCFPYDFANAQLAVEIESRKPASILVWDQAPAPGTENVFCLGDRDHRPLTRHDLVAKQPEDPAKAQ